MTFASGTTQAQVNAVAQQIAYANASDAPPSSVAITWTFADGNSGTQGSGGNLSVTGTTTVIITAVNDAAVIGNPSVSTVTEDVAVTAGKLTASGTLTISDVDSPATFSTTVTGVNSPWGTLTLAADGTYSYSVDNSLAALQALNNGQTRVDTFRVTATDGTTKDVSFTINGVTDNIAPVAASDGLTTTRTGHSSQSIPTPHLTSLTPSSRRSTMVVIS